MIWAFKWSDLIDGALRRLSFLREKLDYEVDQLDAVQRLRLRYGDLIPEPDGTIPSRGDRTTPLDGRAGIVRQPK
jgi:hypothetical protein